MLELLAFANISKRIHDFYSKPFLFFFFIPPFNYQLAQN